MDRRLEFVDIARGIGILLVVLGHSITKPMANDSEILNIIRLFIYVVHMPLFFIISGYLFEKNNEKYLKDKKSSYVLKKIEVFMIPYLSFALLNYFIVFIGSMVPKISEILANEGYVIESIPQVILGIIAFINPLDEHLWFCYVMFLVLIINRLFIKKNSVKIIIILFLIYLISTFVSKYMPDLITKTIKYLPVFAIGRLVANEHEWKGKEGIVLLAISIISFILLIICKKINYNFVTNIDRIIVEISVGLLIMFYISTKINVIVRPVGKVLNYLGNGRNSFAIYLLHMPFLTSGCVFLLQKINFNNALVILISTSIGIIIPLLLYKFILSKNKFIQRFFFGEKQKII